MLSQILSTYETEKVMAEIFYAYYPNHTKINNAIWEFFSGEDFLWPSEIKKIAEEIGIDARIILVYLQLLVDKDNETPLLRQNFYELTEDGELKLIRLSMSKVLSEAKNISTQEEKEAFIHWAKGIYTCWETIKDEEDLILLADATFNFPSNNLWQVVQSL